MSFSPLGGGPRHHRWDEPSSGFQSTLKIRDVAFFDLAISNPLFGFTSYFLKMEENFRNLVILSCKFELFLRIYRVRLHNYSIDDEGNANFFKILFKISRSSNDNG
jgi:hypothetical protein